MVRGGICSLIAVVVVMAAATSSVAAVPTAVLAKKDVDEYGVTASSGYLV